MTAVVGVDISGRHEEGGRYLMVAAAVHAEVDATRIHRIDGIGFATSEREPTLEAAVTVVAEAVAALPSVPDGHVVAERGEFYGDPDWRIDQYLGPDFKYVETIAERETVQAAHHAAYAARDIVL